MLLKSNIKDLKKTIKPENILLSYEERFCYAQDSTNIKENLPSPDAVIFVENIDEVINIVKYANKHKIPIISRGAGTNMVGACTCLNGGIVLNFSKMNKIIDFSPENMTMKVQPGVVLNDIKQLAESSGLFYPPDPSNYKVSTIGGSIAQSSGGAMSFKYGTTKDYILSLTVVLADGTLMQLGSGTIKDAVGYHLNQLIIGSEGTLAIVVEAELKLIPKPEKSAVVISYFDSINDSVNGVNEIIKNRVFPSTIDFLDKNAISTIESFYPTGLETNHACLLLTEVDGFASSIDTQLESVKNALMNANAANIITINDDILKDRVWTARRASYAAVTRLAPDVVTDDIVVPRNALYEMIDSCINICNKYKLQLCIIGHVGDGNLHPQIALDLDNDEEYKNYLNAKSEIYKKAIELGGTISAEHGVGCEKISYIESAVDQNSLEYMKRIKLLFDPNNILNPGKIFNL